MSNKMETDVKKDWFMQQHFNSEELQQIYEWEQKSGKVGDIIPGGPGFCLYNIADTERKIILCSMQEEYMLRRWTERLGYKTSDGKTAQQFEDEHGIKDAPIVAGKEVYEEDHFFLTKYGENKFKVLSSKYSLVAKRTASNAYEILLLNSEEYAKHLEEERNKK
jgi:hypothetical protein